jgi:DNA-binding response OmpR family regulator
MATVLLIEDEILLADCYVRWLVAAGHDAYHVRDAQSALDAVDERIPQVILLDILLAGANGVQVLHAVRSHADLSQVPIIICSNAVSQGPSDLSAYGVRAVLDKTTVTRQSLAAAIAKVL